VAADDGHNSIRALHKACDHHGLGLLLEIDVTDAALDHPLVRAHPECFSFTADSNSSYVDPRVPNLLEGRAIATPQQHPEPFVAWWSERLSQLVAAGANGFCLAEPQKLGAEVWRLLFERVRNAGPAPLLFVADTSQLSQEAIVSLERAGFDYTLSSLPWWNGRAPWLVEQHSLTSLASPAIALVEAPRREPPASCEVRRARLATAAVTGAGVMMPFGYDTGHCEGDRSELSPYVKAMNSLLQSRSGAGKLRSLTGPGDAVTMLLRTDQAEIDAQSALVMALNPHPTLNAIFDDRFCAALGEWSVLHPVDPFTGGEKLSPGDVRLFRAERPKPVVIASRTPTTAVRAAAEQGRVWIGNVAPSVDDGLHPAKVAAGQIVNVEADLVPEGHGQLAAELLYRADDERNWHRTPMRLLGNDRWQARVRPTRIGRYRFQIEAWPDVYGTYVHDLAKKRVAKVDTELDIEEGHRLIDAAKERAGKSAQSALTDVVAAFARASIAERAQILLSPETITAMARADPRERKTISPVFCIDSERRAAQFGSWYELFPRSQSPVPGRHGTFSDVIARIPAIAAMGFDVLYLTPIHPIGSSNRKGRNNALSAEEGDPGSTYAIGSPEGGHTAIHPELGTLEDFRELVRAAHAAGMEIALDFAVQCSPDHPWLTQHPGWFDWRPDGSIKYAENPPKRYEDIVNVDFYAKDAIPGLWLALRDIALFWIEQGVKIFRVDNPHTKPFPFWQWLLSDIRRTHPDTVFLSEAFTRPKVMYHLAKLGFSQSYTYFTWRNTKYELTSYINELTSAPIAWFFRPNFFVNTPDINPYFLQNSGRAGFVIRAALATMLAGSWGMYSGFELCESEPLPGREEYRDSEKYELKFRDWNAPGNIIREITAFNRLRRSEPALQTHLGTTFYNAFNDNILYFGRYTGEGAERILVAISLDPHHPQQADFEIPLWEWGLPDSGALLVHDLLRGGSWIWHGKIQHMWLSPDAPVSIWRVRPAEVP
jgi:starch synthase (maltosyl-transferring)